MLKVKFRQARFLLYLALLFVLMVGVSLETAVAQKPAEFKADFTTVDAKGNEAAGTIYVKNNEIRQETITDGEVAVTILRLDLKKSWVFMPDNMYMEVPLPVDPNAPQNPDYEMATIGQEKLNGYDCEIIQYTYKKKSLGVLVQWVAKDLNYAIKTETKDSRGRVTSRTEFSNITLGNQDDSLFEIPAGYRKFSLFGK